MRTELAIPTGPPRLLASSPSGREVFEILARENADMLVAYLRSFVVAPDVVDDLFQEAMLIAWRRLGDYDRDRAFGPWLRGIARKLVLKHRERRARDVVTCPPEVFAAVEDRYDEVTAEGRAFDEVMARLERCLEKLPAALRIAVEFAHRQGLRMREVARRLGTSEEAVKKRVQRGRRLLAECIRAEEGRA